MKCTSDRQMKCTHAGAASRLQPGWALCLMAVPCTSTDLFWRLQHWLLPGKVATRNQKLSQQEMQPVMAQDGSCWCLSPHPLHTQHLSTGLGMGVDLCDVLFPRKAGRAVHICGLSCNQDSFPPLLCCEMSALPVLGCHGGAGPEGSPGLFCMLGHRP